MKFIRSWCVWFSATALSLVLLVCSRCGELRLRQRLREMESAQRNMMAERFVPKYTPAGLVDRIALSSICMEIFNACTNSRYAAFGVYADNLRPVWGEMTLTGDLDWKRIECVLRHCAHDGFLLPVQPLRFESAEEFAKYIQVNIDLCCLCGSLHVRRKEFEKAQFIEPILVR